MKNMSSKRFVVSLLPYVCTETAEPDRVPHVRWTLTGRPQDGEGITTADRTVARRQELQRPDVQGGKNRLGTVRRTAAWGAT